MTIEEKAFIDWLEKQFHVKTTEEAHAHVCPVCGDAWWHASEACEPIYGGQKQTWAKCPQHEGREDE